MGQITQQEVDSYVTTPSTQEFERAGLLGAQNAIKRIAIVTDRSYAGVTDILEASASIGQGEVIVSEDVDSGSYPASYDFGGDSYTAYYFSVEFTGGLAVQVIPNGIFENIVGLTTLFINDIQVGGPVETWSVGQGNYNPKLIMVQKRVDVGPPEKWVDMTYSSDIHIDQESGYDIVEISKVTSGNITEQMRVLIV